MKRWICGVILLWVIAIGIATAHPNQNPSAAETQDRQSILSTLPSQYRVHNLRISRPWALLCTYDKNSPSAPALTHLLHRGRSTKWSSVVAGGGAMWVSEVFSYGVPIKQVGSLLKQQPTAQEIEQALSQGPRWPQDSRDYLMDNDLEGISAWELHLRLHETLARHGKPFPEAELKEYFGQRRWYKADPHYTDSRLNDFEKQNLGVMDRYRKKNGLWID